MDIQTDIEKPETKKKGGGTSQAADNEDTKTDRTQTETSEQTDEKKKAVLNIEQGIMPSQGLSFAVPHTKVEFAPALLRQFRQWRFMSDTDRTFFDIDATVKRVTTQGDTADPVYKFQRKHVEYLMIVEQNTYKNHTAAFIKSIHSTLNNNNIDVLLFTFDTDPRILYTKLNRKKYTINQVFAQYSHAVLLYFGSASLWFDTQNYRIYPWTNILKRWEQRYWFPDNSPDNWHLTEHTGSKIFPNVLPFSLDALQLLTNHFVQNSRSSWFNTEYWKNNFDYALTDVNTQLPLDVIALHFHPLVRVWIAACAVYPEVSWDLTLELGKILSHEEYNLCSTENILQLLRLDWFRHGYIPPEIRFALMETWLPPDVNIFVNQHIVKLMQSDACKDILQKHPAFRMQLAIHELLAETNEQKRTEIAQNLKKDIEASGTADFVALQYINEAELSPVFFRLPDELLATFEQITGKKLKTKKEPQTGKNFTQKVGNTAFDMIFVKGGTFQMGSNEYNDEKPIHKVTLSDFYIGKFQVTQKLYQAIMGNNPSNFKGENNPVETVSWYDAVEFCNKLSEKAGKQPYYNIDKNKKDPNNKNSSDDIKWTVTINKGAKGYRLLTEAEWEYAARGGVSSARGHAPLSYSGSNNIDEVAWYEKNSGSKTHPVGEKKPNELGIYDMSGNVWEWCYDWYGKYEKGDVENPQGAENGTFRVFRGGSWDDFASYCRVANRFRNRAYNRYDDMGFRIALSL